MTDPILYVLMLFAILLAGIALALRFVDRKKTRKQKVMERVVNG